MSTVTLYWYQHARLEGLEDCLGKLGADSEHSVSNEYLYFVLGQDDAKMTPKSVNRKKLKFKSNYFLTQATAITKK